MSPPPPPGFPWLVDVGGNPNINRDPPPPPDDGAPQVGVIVNGPDSGLNNTILLANTVPGPATMSFGPPPPYGAVPLPGVPPLHPNGGPPLYTNHPSHSPFPPPPIPGSGISPLGWGGAYGGFPQPYASGGFPWIGGAGYGGMAGMGMPGMYGGLGYGGFGWPDPYHKYPPPIIDGGVGPVPGPQNDPTVRPEGDLPGHTVVQPAETTAVYRIHCNWPPWQTTGVPLTVEPMQIDSGWTINRLIGAMRLPDTDCQGWAVTECIELGNGRWAKGVQFHHGQQQATEQTMGMVGWGQNRNRNGESPLYLYCHRI